MTCLPGKWCSGVRSVPAQASDDQKMLGLLAKKKKVVSIKCEPLNGVKWATHTDNATLDHCFSFFPKCCGFHLSSFPDWTTKDRDVVCIYRVRAYTKPGCGRMQLLAFFYQIMRFSLLWNKPEVFLKKQKTQYCFSFLHHPLSAVSQISICTQCQLPGKPQVLRPLRDRVPVHAGTWPWGPAQGRRGPVQGDSFSGAPEAKESLLSWISCRLPQCKDGS